MSSATWGCLASGGSTGIHRQRNRDGHVRHLARRPVDSQRIGVSGGERALEQFIVALPGRVEAAAGEHQAVARGEQRFGGAIGAREHPVAPEVRQCRRKPRKRDAADRLATAQVGETKVHLHRAREMGYVFARGFDVGLAETGLPVPAEDRHDRARHRRRVSVVQDEREQVLDVVVAQEAAVKIARTELAQRHQRVARYDRPGLVQAQRFGARLPDIARAEVLRKLLLRARFDPVGNPQPARLRRRFVRTYRGALAPEPRDEPLEHGSPMRRSQRRFVDLSDHRATRRW
jgi:hypothetical protein